MRWFWKWLLVYRRLALVIAAGLLLGAAGLVYRQVAPPYPSALFWDALQQNLSQPGLTCTIRQSDATSSSTQAISLDLASKTGALAETTLISHGSQATTEEITTSQGDFIRYQSISTDKAGPGGAKPDFSKVVDIWAKNTDQPADNSTLLGRTALGNCVVPLADLSPAKAAQIGGKLRSSQAFEVNAASRNTLLHGMAARQYQVTIQPRRYVELMRQIGQAYGLPDLTSVNADSLDGRSAPTLTFYIATGSRQLAEIDYGGLPPGERHVVTFSNYGKAPKLSTPHAALTSAQLRARLAGQ